ncbi:MAG TPA: alanine racemase [Solirubrobacteraceae bacterium]|jgi:alanine racemase|nr:alanine racemase [Solirubrobacteraceae bacterium]
MSVARAQARVNVAAIERNCARLRRELRPGVQLCAVVKADAYGHGVLPCARAALAGGASWLAVVSGGEALELRAQELAAARVLVMGALTPGELEQAVQARADVVAWREHDVAALARAGGGRVHVKLDTGMGRLGTRDPDEASRVLAAARAAPGVSAVGAMTHFATADEADDDGFFSEQLERFAAWANEAKAAQPDLLLHAANSAAVLRDAAAHFDLVRCGIAIYGMDPLGEDPAARELEPALELTSYVAEVKRCRAGESAGYGRRFIAQRDTHLGVLPIGYGDGWRRGLSNNAEVLIGARRYPLVGTVSMDSITVDLGPGADAERLRGELATLIGSQGEERITAEEVARRLGTINYEVTCALTPRVSRLYHRDGAPLERSDGDAQPGAGADRDGTAHATPARRAGDAARG